MGMRNWLGVIVGLVFATNLSAQGKSRWDEHNTLIRDKETIGQLDGAAFGESISYYAGGLSFTQTDTSIPGNNALPVAISRTYSVTGHRHSSANLPFGDWDIALPSIGGVYATTTGWVLASQNGSTTDRCSVPPYDPQAIDPLASARPPMVGASIGPFHARDYWNGVQLDLGSGPQDILLNEYMQPAEPAGGPWRWLTSDRTFVKCLTTVDNDLGEGFFAIDEHGTKYWFEWMAATLETSLSNPVCDPWGSCGSRIDRKRYRLYATRVEDRFGNYVTYSYSNAPGDPVKLDAISSSDGRTITLTYNTQGNVQTVTENGRSWIYAYDYSDGVTLVSVTRPDTTSWQFDFGDLSSLNLHGVPVPPGEQWTCMQVREVIDADVTVTGSLTHPSGLVGEFHVKPTLFGRTEMPLVCSDYGDPYWVRTYGDPVYPVRWWAPAVTLKRTSGPGLSAKEWMYVYGGEWGFNESPSGAPTQATDGTTWVVVTGPNDEWTRYTFGNRWLKDEGLLLKTEIGTGPSNILRTEINEYIDEHPEATPFNFLAGIGIAPFSGSYSVESRRPLKSRTIEQQGVEFALDVTSFDAWARPLQTTKISTPGASRTDQVAYHDDSDVWVLGQEASIYNVDESKTVVSRTFDSTSALPLTEHQFGWLRDTLAWNADGTLHSVTVGANPPTTLTNWKRGIPRTITYSDGSSTTAVVNDRGEVTSNTDELGLTFPPK